MTGGAGNAFWAGAFFDELARIGVRFVCVAPGSRSTPLVLAAAQDGRFQMVSVIDERSAGFLALGVGKASQNPAVVITTSGTAAANLFPAVIEASQGEVPLLVLTADRPHRLRDTDGNQAMDQIRLFGAFPRAFFDVAPPVIEAPPVRHLRSLAARAVSLAMGPPAGPVHLNFPFEKPLEPAVGPSLSEGGAGLETFRRDHPRAGLGRPDQVPTLGFPSVLLLLPKSSLIESARPWRAPEGLSWWPGPVPSLVGSGLPSSGWLRRLDSPSSPIPYRALVSVLRRGCMWWGGMTCSSDLPRRGRLFGQT
jgi:hypothetical protein